MPHFQLVTTDGTVLGERHGVDATGEALVLATDND
jgi:hypothetical protein